MRKTQLILNQTNPTSMGNKTKFSSRQPKLCIQINFPINLLSEIISAATQKQNGHVLATLLFMSAFANNMTSTIFAAQNKACGTNVPDLLPSSFPLSDFCKPNVKNMPGYLNISRTIIYMKMRSIGTLTRVLSQLLVNTDINLLSQYTNCTQLQTLGYLSMHQIGTAFVRSIFVSQCRSYGLTECNTKIGIRINKEQNQEHIRYLKIEMQFRVNKIFLIIGYATKILNSTPVDRVIVASPKKNEAATIA